MVIGAWATHALWDWLCAQIDRAFLRRYVLSYVVMKEATLFLALQKVRKWPRHCERSDAIHFDFHTRRKSE